MASVDVNTVPPANERIAPSNVRLVTVLEDAKNYNVKHPLQYMWTLWHRPAGGRGNVDWKASLLNIQNCSTVEDFWYMINSAPSVETMKADNDYHLFREGIMPAWEDPANEKGCSLIVNCSDKQASSFWINSVGFFVLDSCMHWEPI